ncbi:hypothetical protein BT96DRAFT_1100483 [Gymnopus androsaceus JB14]|uniref:Uncharacterized protein n=1 Tax=Gymnopus androsaceus JB14 TaxID=1447944 RepID=A0A6A4GFU3_9AGAR|nr:hypothetical protein BT96DRAFT_1100483 [Gymnopus androsaceus JB14]
MVSLNLSCTNNLSTGAGSSINSEKEVKDVAFQYLDACPVDVIRRFINRSFCWMSAYQLKPTKKAAEWAVRKQKTHRSVSASAMMHLNTICQPTT